MSEGRGILAEMRDGTESVLQERLYSGKLTITEVNVAIKKLNSTGVQIKNHIMKIK